MGYFDDYLLVTDFDRTLTNRRDEIPARNLEAIQAFLAEGGMFTVATGRSVPIFRQRAASVPANAPFILCNGAVCFDFSENKALFSRSLPENCIAFVKALSTRYPTLRIELQDLSAHYPVGAQQDQRHAQTHHVPVRYLPLTQIPHPVFKIIVIGPFTPTPEYPDFFVGCSAAEDAWYTEVYEYIQRTYGDQCCAIRSAPRMIEIQPRGTSKGIAARSLANHFERKRLVCVGDAPNDLSMLEEADLAFVPANAAPILSARFPAVDDCDIGAVAGVIAALSAQI